MSMTTPRVTVPVEPTEAMKIAGVHAIDNVQPNDVSMWVTACWSAMLSAAPVPEGGAVPPQVRRLLQLADAALSKVAAYEADFRSLLGPEGYAQADNARSEIRQFLLALATAPAEAGELKADFTRSHPSGLDDSTYEQIEDALDRADAPINGPDGKFLTLAQRVEALRAQPPAREDAQPDTDCVSLLADLDAGKPVGREAAATIRSLIAEHPAPDALRVAVEALEPFAKAFRGLSSRWEDHETHWQDATSPIAVEDLRYADQALAALQAEQKGGA